MPPFRLTFETVGPKMHKERGLLKFEVTVRSMHRDKTIETVLAFKVAQVHWNTHGIGGREDFEDSIRLHAAKEHRLHVRDVVKKDRFFNSMRATP